MWINAIQTGKKPLSPIELLALAVISGDNITAQQVSDKLKQVTLKWEPAAGTLYPILHRLTSEGLLNKSKDKQICFNRTEKGNFILSSNLKAIESQLRENLNYYTTIIDALLKVTPVAMGIHEFMDATVKMSQDFLNTLEQLKKESKSLVDDSYSVPIQFE
jgi:DNA-binding PadR family transcriptional regulator